MSDGNNPTRSFDVSGRDPHAVTGSFRGSQSGLSVELQLLLDEACDSFEATWRRGGHPDIPTALQALPESVRPTGLKELVALDIYYRRKSDETPAATDYAERFPELDPDWLADAVAVGKTIASRQTASLGGSSGAAAPATGSRVGDFELLEELDHGGMGVVYKARQVGLNREVALKMLLAGAYASPALRTRFLVEAESVAALEHPHIVRVFAFGESGHHPYLAMEYLPGGTLAQRLKVGGPMPACEAAELLAKLAEAVAHAHSRGVVHRDIKPGNVLFGADGEPRLADFGLAKVGRADRNLSVTGQVLGTPAYMAPEQAAGKVREVGTVSDVYALGALLYDVLTGRPPFLGDSHAVTLQKVIAEEPARLRSVNPSVPRDLETVCLKCLEKEPTKRYATAQALADELGRYLRGEPVEARRAGSVERISKWVRRNKAVSALVGVSALLVLAAVGGAVALAYSRTLESKNRDLESAKGEAEERRVEADTQRVRAEREEAESWRLLYFAKMHQANAAFQAGNSERVIELLTPYREPTPGKPDPRGFEWHYLWKMARGDLFTIRAHPGGINAVAYSEDGNVIVTGGADGTVRLWNAANGAAGTVFDAGPCRVTGVGFVPGTTWLAASLSKETGGEIRLWDTGTGQVVHERTFVGRVNGLAIHPDGKHVAAACDDGLVRVTNLETGAVRDWKNDGPANCVAFSPDGKRFAAGGQEKMKEQEEYTRGWGRVWDWPDGGELFRDTKKLLPFLGANDAVVDLAFRADSNAILSTASAKRGQLKHYNYSRLTDLQQVADPKNSRLWSTSNLEGGEHLKQARFLTDKQAVIVSEKGQVMVFDLTKKSSDEDPRLWQYYGKTGPIHAVAVSPDQRFMATVGASRSAESLGELRVWPVGPFATPLTVLGTSRYWHVNIGWPVSLSPDGRYIATLVDISNGGEAVRVYSAQTGAVVFTGPLNSVHSGTHVEFSPDSRWLAATVDGGATVWSTENWSHYYNANDPRGQHYGIRVAFSPDSRLLAVAGTGEVVHLHDILTKQLVRTWNVVGGTNREGEFISEVYCVAFSPDGTRLLGSHQGPYGIPAVSVLRLSTGTCELRIQAGAGAGAGVTTAAFSPDGQSILTSGSFGQLAVYDANTGTRLLAPVGEDPKFHVYWCGYSPDGMRILTASGDGSVRLRDARSGQEILTLRPFGIYPMDSARSAAISIDGRRIAVSSANGYIRVIDIPTIDPNPDLDPVELTEVRFQELHLREDVIARLKGEPGLAPSVRAAAIKLAEKHAEDTNELEIALWNVELDRVSSEKSQAERQFRLANAYLKQRPADTLGMLHRGVALYHLGRYAEAETALLNFRCLPAKGQTWFPIEEGTRHVFLALARVRLANQVDARTTLLTLEKLVVANKWEKVESFGPLLAEVRKVVPPPPIPYANE